MTHVLLPICGLLLLASGIRTYLRARSRAALFYATSLGCGWIALTVWPPQNGLWLDGAVGWPGLARMISDISATLCVALQFAFTSTLVDAWSGARRVALVGYAVLMLLIVLLWIWVQREIGARITHFSYGGFYGKPFTVLLWNIAVGSTIVYVCALTVWGYVSLVRVAQDRHSQVNALVSICLFGVASVYGMLAVAQAVADRTGGDLRRVQHLAMLLIVVCAVAGVSLILATVYGRSLWQRLREWLPLRQYQLRKDITGGIVLLSDRITRLLDHVDQEVVAEVARRSARSGLSPYQRRVAVEAARWIAISRQQVAQTLWDAVDPETAPSIDGALAAEAAAQAEDEGYFYGDVYRVARLALDPKERPDLAFRWEGPGWRRRAAHLLSEVLLASKRHNSGHTIAHARGG